MAEGERTFGRKTALALGAGFLLSICLPLLDACFGLATVLPNFEKREYATLPTLLPAWEDEEAALERIGATLASLDRWPAGFESWHNDHFGLRSWLIRWHNIWKARLLATAPNHEVVIGRDGWLYYAGQSNIEQYRALTLMPPELVAGWKLYLAIVREWVEDHGAAYLLVIGPSKETIHPQHLPSTIRQVGATTRLAQFTDELAREGSQWVLDLTPALLEASAERPTYQKTDTHWNSWGSLVAARTLIDELRSSGRFPGLAPLSLSDYRAEERLQPGGDIAELMGLQDLYEELDLVWVPASPDPFTRTTAGLPPAALPFNPPYAFDLDPQHLTDPPPPRALVFHDSFGLFLASFLPRHFARTVFYWQYQPSPEALAQERPDLVLQEIGERVLIRDELKGGDVPFPLDERVRADFERRRAFRSSARVLFRREGPGELELPAFDAGPEQAALLRLDVVVASEGLVRVESLEGVATEEPRALLRGLNVVYLRLPRDGRASRLVLEAPQAELRSLEARAVPSSHSLTPPTTNASAVPSGSG